MKDAAHHLKHTQKKVIQSARKTENSTPINGTSYSSVALESKFIPTKKRKKNLYRVRHSMQSTL